MKKSYKILSLIVAVVYSFGYLTFAQNVDVLEETFETYDTTTPISITTNSGSTGWSLVNALDPEFHATIENVNQNNLLQMKIDSGTVAAHQKVRKEIIPKGVQGLVNYNFRVMIPKDVSNGTDNGTYNVGGGGDIQVNLDDTNNVEIAAFYFTPQSDGIDVKVCGTQELPSKDDYAFTINNAQTRGAYNEWIYVNVTIDTAKNKFYFNVTDNLKLDYTCLESEAVWCRNVRKNPSYTGIPRYVSSYYFRKSKNRLTYIDNFTVSAYVDESIEFVQQDKAALTTGLENPNHVTEDFTLPTIGNIHSSKITWESNSPAVVINENGNASITRGDELLPVTLKAIITYNTYFETKEFAIKLAPALKEKLAPLAETPIYTLKNGDSETSITKPETGFVNTEITVKNAGSAGASGVNLIVTTTENATGRIIAVSSDTKQIISPNRSVTLKTGVQFGGNGFTYKYYLWDNNGVSLLNSAPAKVTLNNIIPKTKSAILSWNNADDDFNAINEYVICRNNEKVGSSYSNNYTDENLTEDTDYNYTITAIDHGGRSTVSESVGVKTTSMLRCRLLGLEQADVDKNSNYLNFLVNNDRGSGDSHSNITEKDGVACRQTVDRADIQKSLTYLYFKTDKSVLNQNNKDVILEITYFDEGSGIIYIQYNAVPEEGKDPNENNIAKREIVAVCTNSGTWKTATLKLTDAQFRSPSKLTNCDFRLFGSGEIFISEVAAIQTEKY